MTLTRDKLFDNHFSADNLEQIATHHAKTATHRGADGVSPIQYLKVAASDLHLARQKVDSQQYGFTRLKRVYKLKAGGVSVREICIPTTRDRVILKALTNYLGERGLPRGPGLPTSVNSQVYRAIFNEQLELRAFARTDIENFFPTVPHSDLMRRLSDGTLDKRALSLLEGVLSLSGTDNSGVPQGLSIATCLTEFHLRSILASTLAEIQASGSRAYRYVDDILILSPSQREAREHVKKISSVLSTNGYTTHPITNANSDKSGLGSIQDGFVFLGYQYDSTGASVPHQKLSTVLDRVAKVISTYRTEAAYNRSARNAEERANWYMQLAMNGCIWRGRRRGWLPFYLGTNDLNSFGIVTHRARQMIQRAGLAQTIKAPDMIQGFYAYRRNRTQQILNLDNFSVDQKRDWLATVAQTPMSEVFEMSADTIVAEFDNQIESRLHSVEHDLSLHIY